MKKLFIILQSTFICLAMILVGFVFGNGATVNADSTESKVYANDFYTIAYENNEFKLLLNADLTVYKNLKAEDLTALKDNLASVIYAAILDDLDFTELAAATTATSSNPLLGDVDMSLIGSIIGGQLTDVDKVDEALSGNKYDVLIEYYVDRYVDAYVEANDGASVEDTLVEVQTQLTETIQKTVEEVYKDVDGEDLSEYAPLVDVASKVENIVTQVQENKQNDTQINVSLGDVKDIINIVNDKQVIVDVINEIQVKDEISDIIVNSTPEEAVDFITNVEMDTIIEVYKNVEISKEEVKDIITNVGTDNLIDIVDKVGMDSIKDLANAMDFTKEELKETITNSVADISVASIIKTIKFISVDGAKVYEEGQFVAAGLGTIVKKLPKLSEIATLSDDKMNWSWDIKASTILGDVEFKLTVGFKGNCSYIRKLAQELADVIDVKVENGVYFVEINSPEKLSNILLRLTNTGALSDDVKHALFANLFGTVDNLYQNITDKTLAEYIEILKQVDYKVVVANLYNAEKLNSVFGTDKFTDEKLDAFVDEVCGLISKAAAYDYDDVKALVGKYVDISKLDDTAVETLVNKVSTVLKEIDALSIDSALIREFIDPNSKYTNENVYDYLDKLENYEGYYNKALELVEKLYNKVPDRYKDNTVLDFYQGNGKFNYTGTVNLELEKVLTTINKNYGQKVYDALSILFDTLPEKVNVSITLNIKNVYSVTYHVGNEIIEGMLPAGADVAFFANRTEIDGNAITKWVDKDGTEYTTMPNYDVELYACAEYVASIESGVNKKYDGKPFTLKVNIEPAAPYTYQWYKNGVAVDGATKETLDVINVADSGTYYCVVTLGNTVYTTNSVEVVIEKGFIDLRDAVWAYPHPFDYTGQQYEVKLVGTLANVTVSYIGNKATNAGKYIAQAVFTYDEANYVLSEKIVTLSWEIRKAKIYVEGLEWNYVNPFTYDEASHEVKLTNVPANLTVAYEGNVATNAGKYTAKAVVSCADANYELIGGTSELTWEIAKGKIDVSGLSWKYSKGFTYNGAEFGVELNGTVKGATPKYENNKATKAGKYVAKVTFEYDQANYELTGEVEDLTWEIRKAKIDVTKVEWNYSGAFTEDGTEKQVSLKADSIPVGVTVAYENNKATAAGKYVAVAKFALNDTDNYELVGTDAKLSWEIKAKTVDPEPHKHVFVDGVCECGEKDPNYVEPEVGKKEFEVKDENGKVVVTITSKDGVVATEVSLKELNAKDYDLDLEALFGEDKAAKLLAVYDIEFLDENGKPLELTGEFTVKLLLSEEHKDLEGLTVVHIAEDGTTTEHTAKVEGEYITFSTTHFSVYSLVQVKDAPSNAWVIWLVIILLIAIVVPVVFIVIKKKISSKNQETEEVKLEKTEVPTKKEEVLEEDDDDEDEEVLEETPAVVEAVEEEQKETVTDETVETTEEVVVEETPEAEEVLPVIRIKRIKRTFMSNLMVAPAETKANFNEVKNYLMMYGAVEKLISRCEAFRINDNKTLIAKVAIGGKNIKIFLAIDPLTLEGTKYKYKDYSAKKAYTEVPTLVKVRSARSMKYFKEIVDMMMARFGVEKSEDFESADYLNSLIPNGQAILGKLRLPAECLVESVDAKEIPADIPEGLIEQLHVLEAEALDEEKVEANVYLDTVANNFENGDLVNIDVLKSKHIVKQGNTIRVKARGTLNKQITIYAEEFDDDAVKMLLATNCTAIRIVRK